MNVHGVEFAFGFHKQSTTGIFEGEPKQCEGFTFREQILIGWTEMSLKEIRTFMEELARDYKGNSYNLITRNCNHFCIDACIRLTGNPIPSWINRLAKIGKSRINFQVFNLINDLSLRGATPLGRVTCMQVP
ncbi:putative PPPDE peptidase domain-containing protein [Helianthus annuus]|nr:putative PPPDE peptidase domain-containing protein [Helianthus annuus]KAJ0617494.1 putative PPPDE peptidase domain-containing protein [Helianthus annuus]KAJ0776032.1 putative PPPDE peptidase domain-containing protein [Helianthus annuus]